MGRRPTTAVGLLARAEANRYEKGEHRGDAVQDGTKDQDAALERYMC
jgi:hypothetical protein